MDIPKSFEISSKIPRNLYCLDFEEKTNIKASR